MNNTRPAHRTIVGPESERLRWYLSEFGRYPSRDELIALRPYRSRRRALAAVKSS